MTRATRSDAIATLEQGQAKLDDLLARLSEQDLILPATMGGGDWSAKDLIGHIAFWEEVALAVLDAWRRGRSLNLAEAFVPGGTNRLNAWNRDRKARWSLHKVRRDAGTRHRELMTQVRGLTDEDWGSLIPSGARRRSRLGTQLGAVLSAPKRPFGHAFAHIPDLKAYVASIAA